jgi:hypothetical protein
LNGSVTNDITENIKIHFYSEVISVHDMLELWVQVPYKQWEDTFVITEPSPERAKWLYGKLRDEFSEKGVISTSTKWFVGVIYAQIKSFPKIPIPDSNLRSKADMIRNKEG